MVEEQRAAQNVLICTPRALAAGAQCCHRQWPGGAKGLGFASGTGGVPRYLLAVGGEEDPLWVWRSRVWDCYCGVELSAPEELAAARDSRDGPALVRLAINESDALLKLGQFLGAAEVASRGFDAARRAGLQSWYSAATLAANAAEALLALGRTEQAAALIDPLIIMPPDRDKWAAAGVSAEIDLLRGSTSAAAGRWQRIFAFPAHVSRVDFAYESAPRAVEASLWAGHPGDGLAETRRALALFQAPDLTILCGRLLTAGMRACADLAGQARARRDQGGAAAAAAAADDLAGWVGQMGGAPFADHPFVAAIPAERATWDAERTRLAGPGNPEAWAGAAKAWQDLGCPHRAGYAWWRQAQTQLDAGQPAAAAAGPLRAAAAAAAGHAPLLAQIRALAGRARIPLQPPAPAPAAPPPTGCPPPTG